MESSFKRLAWSWATVLIWMASQTAMAETKHAGEEKNLKSVHSDVEALITFHNVSGRPVKVYWLDFAGNRVLYLTLQDGDKVGQATYLTHPWVVTDENDDALALYYADGQSRTVEIAASVAAK